MDARDPLSGRTITTVFPQGRNRVILTLSTGEQILLVSSSSSELPSLSVLLQQVTAAFDLLQPFLGLTKYQTGDYLAFTHIPGDTLNQRISRISVNPLLDWSYESLAGHMQMMGNALSHLHQSQLIHWKINTRSFFCGVNNKIILGGLEEIKVAGNGKFEKAKYKELTWLGACFASMITKVDFKQLVELDANKQLSMCRTNPKFTGVVYDMTKDALSGQWRGNYLPDDTTMSQLFETSRIVLPPPPISFSRLSSKEERTLLEALAGLATEGNESWDEAPKPVRIGGNKDSDADDTKSLPEMPSFLSSFSVDFCGVCRGPAVFSAPCTHSYCLPCFASHVHSLAAQSLQADSLICRVCARPLPVDFVFEHIRGNSVVISALDEALLRSQLISCPKCKRKIDRMLDEGPARNATCTYCGKKFCILGEMQTSAAGTQLPGLVTTTYTVVCDEKGLFKRQTATEQMTRKPAPPPDEFSFQALLANIIKVTLGRSLALQQPRKLERRATQLHLKPVLNVSAIDSDLPRNRDIKSARVEVQLYIPRNEEAKTKGKRTHSKLNMVIKECNEVQESLMPIWQMASSTVTTKRKELGETKQVLQTATEELNIWRTNTLYRSGKEALERRMKDRESKLEREDRALLSHLLGVKSQPCSPVSSDLASIRSLRFAQKLRRHKRGFGKGFGEVMEARASAPASPAREWKGFKGETEEQALLREIRHYRMSEIQLSGDEKVVSPPRTEAPSPTGELLSPADAVNDLNKFIFRARGKYHSKSISDLNKKRRMMLEAKMERIAPSPDVLQKAILLMEKEKQKKSLKASRIDNLKQTPFSRLHSQWFKDKLPVDDDYRRTSLGEQSAIETVMRKSQQKKQVVRNMKLIAKQV